MSINPKMSDLQLIWETYTDFESFTRKSDCDLNHFIEQWKEKMAKTQSTGCQYSDLALGLKLIEKVNLSHDSIVSVISKLSSSTSDSENFLTQVVTNIKKQSEVIGSSGNQNLELITNPRANQFDQEISEELKINGHSVSCPRCPVKFLDKESLSKHQLQFHEAIDQEESVDSDKVKRSNSGFLKCPICAKNFMLKGNLKKHIKSHNNAANASEDESSFDKLCIDSSEFDEVNEKDDSILNSKVKTEIKIEACKENEIKKGLGKPFKCSKCSKGYEKLWMVTKHMEVHKTTKDHKCSYCDNSYKGKDGLRKHLLKMHPKDQPTPQAVASNEPLIKTKKEKRRPKRNMDEKMPRRKLPCEICGKSIAEDGMRKHFYRWHLTEYKCNVCPKEFPNYVLLSKHMEIHSQSHECSICQKAFKGRLNLKLHMETHRTTRDFTCAYCGKKYKTKHVLKEHLNLHTKANPMPCSFCDKIFYSYASRKFHVRRHHTGEKPYKCDFCEKRFYTSSKKVEHMRYHTGEKPFPCHICGRYFRDYNTRKMHVKNVHKEVKPINT